MPDVSLKPGVPDWLDAKGVKPGEFLTVTKMQLSSKMRPGPGNTLKTQVWACGILASPGYQGELATTMRNGKRVPLTPTDIINKLHKAAIEHYRDAGIKATDAELLKLREEKEEIRRALVSLELDGLAERQTADGKPLRSLTTAELQRLPSGKTRMYFWLRPRPADAEVTRRDWEERQTDDMSKVEVGTGCLPHPAISQILKLFNFESPGRAQITNPAYQKNVVNAWEIARKSFIDALQPCLPQALTPIPRQVGATGGAFESNVESNGRKQAAGSATAENPEDSLLPAIDLQRELARRKLSVGEALAHNIIEAMGRCPLFHFLDVLDRRSERGAIGTGLLLYIATDASKEFAAMFSETEVA